MKDSQELRGDDRPTPFNHPHPCWSPERRRQLAEDVVARTMQAMPAPLREAAEAVTVLFQDIPDESVLEEGFEPDLLGLFEGETLDASCSEGFNLPTRILLFLQNLEAYAESGLDVYREEVRRTYLHELGHYLGLDEDDLLERGID